jgi:hypothetical protein
MVPENSGMSAARNTRSEGSDEGAAQFLNIDLDVRSRRSLAPLAAAWPRAQRPLRRDGRPNPHWLILSGPGTPQSAERVARGLLDQVEALSPAAKRSWKAAFRRVFDIGVQAGVQTRTFEEIVLKTETLRRLAAVGASVQITLYPPLR